MKNTRILTRILLIFIVSPLFLFFTPLAFAEETGFHFPTLCTTNGSSCENMREQDTKYNLWPRSVYQEVVASFTGFNIPENALIDDVQIKFRVRTSSPDWTWFVDVSKDNGVNYYPPDDSCRALPPGPCRYDSTQIFNSIVLPTMTWLNNAPNQIIDGKDINSSELRMRIWNAAYSGTQAEVDTLLFNIRYHVPPPLVRPPLLLIPGIGGSELKVSGDTFWSQPDGHGGTYSHLYRDQEKVWVNVNEVKAVGNDDYFDILRMKPDGITSEANVQVTGTLFSETYDPTLVFFKDNGYVLDKDFFIFAYDWRKDVNLNIFALDNKIDDIKQKTGSQKVDIVAHSMGGLIASSYISDSSKASKIKTLILLGTPHLGSVGLLKNLMYGGCFTREDLENLPICIGIPPTEVKDVVQNSVGGYELAPSKTYYSFYSGIDNEHGYPFVDTRDVDSNGITGSLTYDEAKNLLTNLGYNTSLFTPSEEFHNLDTILPMTNGVKVTNIVGSGEPTLGQIVERYSINFAGIKLPVKDELMINGDNTVPLFSASLDDPENHHSLLGGAKVYYTKQVHGALPGNGPALNLVKNILADDTTLPVGVSTIPYPFKGKTLSVHSPVNMHVYDSLGNHTGPTADGYEENIPGSTYDTLDDAKFIFLPDEGIYDIRFEATDKGSFDFYIRNYENSENTKSTYYKHIPLTEDTTASTTLDTTDPTPPVLAVDEDNNGVVDKQVSATSQVIGDENADTSPPETTIMLTGKKGTNDWFTGDVTITLSASDSASGVAKTEYTLDGGTRINTYTSPFLLTENDIYKLKVKSMDAAGNEEYPKEMVIKIDKTPPEAKIFIDQDLQDLIIDGIDANLISVTKSGNPLSKNKSDSIYSITDLAGNTLKLDVRDTDRDKRDYFSIYSLTYNSTSPVILDKNHYTVTYQGKKDKINVKEENFEVNGQIKIRIQYDAKKNKSTISTTEGKKEVVKEVRAGIVILRLETRQGTLKYTY